MNSKWISPFLVILSTFSLLTSWDSYRIVELKEELKEALFAPSPLNVSVLAKLYDAEESKLYLRRDLLDRGYQPIQITIVNRSQHTLGLSSQGIEGIELASVNEVSGAILIKGLPRSVAYKVAAALFWPFAIPSVIDSFRTFHAQEKLRLDYYSKTLKNLEEFVPPYAKVERVIFVPCDQIPESFSLSLFDFDSGKEQTFQIFV